MKPPLPPSSEIGRGDPIDGRLGQPAAAAPGTGVWRRRVALGLAPVTAPVLLFVPIGFAVGPLALGLVTPAVLVHLDLAVSIALAALGVFVGLELAAPAAADRDLHGAAAVEAATTIVIVASACAYLVGKWGLPLDLDGNLAALSLAIGASASAALALPARGHVRRVASRIADLDDLLPIVAGALVLSLVQGQSLLVALRLNAAGILIAVALAIAGWLLFERASGRAERDVFVVGILLLLGGSAAYLGVSPLLVGMVAALFWRVSPGGADRVVHEDLVWIQRPLVALLLLTAGASVTPSLEALWLLAAFVVFRLAGKLLGGWLAAHILGGVKPSELGVHLLPPGVIGIAFVLNLQQVSDTGTAAAVGLAVSGGSILFELVPALIAPAPEGR